MPNKLPPGKTTKETQKLVGPKRYHAFSQQNNMRTINPEKIPKQKTKQSFTKKISKLNPKKQPKNKLTL